MGEQEKREEVDAVLKAVSQEKKRTVFVFEHPQYEGQELKISAFPPNLPELEVGMPYHFTVVHVPTGDGKSHYHNLARQKRDGPYDILKTGGAQPTHSQVVAAPGPLPQSKTIEERFLSRDDYWGRKEKADMAKQPIIMREACLKSAADIMNAFICTGGFKGSVPDDACDALEAITLRLERFCLQAGKPLEQEANP